MSLRFERAVTRTHPAVRSAAFTKSLCGSFEVWRFGTSGLYSNPCRDSYTRCHDETRSPCSRGRHAPRETPAPVAGKDERERWSPAFAPTRPKVAPSPYPCVVKNGFLAWPLRGRTPVLVRGADVTSRSVWAPRRWSGVEVHDRRPGRSARDLAAVQRLGCRHTSAARHRRRQRFRISSSTKSDWPAPGVSFYAVAVTRPAVSVRSRRSLKCHTWPS